MELVLASVPGSVLEEIVSEMSVLRFNMNC